MIIVNQSMAIGFCVQGREQTDWLNKTMCGRFTLTQSDGASIQRAFDLPQKPDDLPPDYNITPGRNIAVIGYNAEHQPTLGMMHWGLIPSWAKDRSFAHKMINARGETLSQKPSFRAAFERRRCLVVADGFYEWRKNADGTKTPFYMQLSGHALFGFAGLWERWQDLLSCTIITTEPNEKLAPIHNRMPVILPTAHHAAWLDPQTPTEALKPHLRPYHNDAIERYAVSEAVNHPKNNNPDLIAPLES